MWGVLIPMKATKLPMMRLETWLHEFPHKSSSDEHAGRPDEAAGGCMT